MFNKLCDRFPSEGYWLLRYYVILLKDFDDRRFNHLFSALSFLNFQRSGFGVRTQTDLEDKYFLSGRFSDFKQNIPS